MAPPARPPGRAKTILRNALPWLVAVVAVGWMTRVVHWHDLRDSFQHAAFCPFLVASALLLVANCAADCFAMYYTFGWFGCRVPYRELFIVRAATYLLAVVQYYVGQAAIIGFLYNRKRVPGWRAAGFILFISGINMGVLVVLAAIGMATGDAPLPWLRWVAAGVGGGALVYALVLKLRPRILADRRLFAPLFEMNVRGHVLGSLVRLPHVLVLLVWHYVALRVFGVEVPPFAALVYLPVVFVAAALPLSFQGLGLSQLAALTFFAQYAKGNAPVIAYTITMTGISTIVQVGMGLIFVGPGRALGLGPPAPPPAAAAEPVVAEASDG